LPFVGLAALLLSVIIIFATELQARQLSPLASDRPSFDYGDVRASVVLHDFTIYNTSDSEIEIVGLVKRCGCTKATIEQHRLPPSAKTVVACSYDLRGRAGGFATSLDIVYKHAGKAGALLLSIHANVEPRVRLSAQTLVFDNTNPVSAELTIDIPAGDCRVTSVSISHRAFVFPRS
jgi:hypothetical protein